MIKVKSNLSFWLVIDAEKEDSKGRPHERQSWANGAIRSPADEWKETEEYISSVRPCVVLLSSPHCLPHSETDKCQHYCGPAEALKSPMLFAEVTNPFIRRYWLLVTHTHTQKCTHTLVALFHKHVWWPIRGRQEPGLDYRTHVPCCQYL